MKISNDGVLPIWQPIGYSTHIISTWVSQKLSVKTAHTGTIDPMAEGVIIILLGEDRHKKYEYAGWIKEYVFEIAFGVSTDTYDGLGLVTEFREAMVLEEKLQEILSGFLGSYEQVVPPYSAIKVKGKPLHYFARNGLLGDLELPHRSGEILEIEMLEFSTKEFGEVASVNLERIKLVKTGDLRQEEVSARWQEMIKSITKPLPMQVAKIRVKMTKGLYVRSLAQDISQKLGVPGFVLSLVRTQNGDYTKENSNSVEEILPN